MAGPAVCDGFCTKMRAEEPGAVRRDSRALSAILEQAPGLVPWGQPGGKVISAWKGWGQKNSCV